MRFPRLFSGSEGDSQTVEGGAAGAGRGGRNADPAGAGDAPADVPDIREAWADILGEFQRARRYERTITIAVITVARSHATPRPGAGDKGAPPWAGRRPHVVDRGGDLMPVVLAAALRQAVRETDVVAWDPAARRCIIVMPEIGIEEGRRAVGRMQEVCASGVGCVLGADVAEFPADGWTFEELLEAATEKRRVSDLRLAARAVESAGPQEAPSADGRPRATVTSEG